MDKSTLLGWIEAHPAISQRLSLAKRAVVSPWLKDDLERQLSTLSKQAHQYLQDHPQSARIKILWSPSFNILQYFSVHDGLLATALRLRGAEIVPFMCGGIQDDECSVLSGAWAGYDGQHRDLKRRNHCDNCSRADTKAWSTIWKMHPEELGRYISTSDVQASRETIGKLTLPQLLEYSSRDVAIGRLASDIVMNSNLVGAVNDTPEAVASLKAQAANGLLLQKAYERIFDRHQPDRVITHDGTYLMWALWNAEACRRGIPYFSYYMGDRPGSWVYVRNGTALSHKLERAWTTWKSQPLTAGEDRVLDDFLMRREEGKTSILNPMYATGGTESTETSMGKSEKPTALLAANVVWDAAAHKADSPVFGSMFAWIAATVQYFAQHPEWQLIIKPHPIENSPKIPYTKATVEEAVREVCPQLPGNVQILEANTSVSPYAWMERCHLGLVFTSTVGLEMAVRGFPVIPGARAHYGEKGFTVDATSKEEYFDAIRRCLTSRESSETVDLRRVLARRYFYLYSFHYQTEMGLHKWIWGDPPVVKIDSIEELLPGANAALDHVCSSIIDGLPVFSENRWPPRPTVSAD